MKPNPKAVRILLALISVLYFVACMQPNATGAENITMINMFEPDEAANYYVLERMTSPKPNLQVFLQYFVTYDYYHYGFPFFGLSALAAYPLRWTGQFDNLPLLMLVERQVISLLPTLIALLLLVYMQDGFRTYRSVLLYLLLMLVPAVLKNSLWWHPDGLVLLFAVLALFFLWKDQRSYGKFYRWAAVMAGVLTATKLIGVYFFLSIIPLLIMSVREGKLSGKEAFHNWLAFVGITAGAFVLSNPFPFSRYALLKYIYTVYRQWVVVSEGYSVVYASGLAAAWPEIRTYFGSALFLLTALGTSIWALPKGKDKHPALVILCWFVPLTLTVVVGAHFKFQYWLPAALPLLSNLILLFPEPRERLQPLNRKLVQGMLAILVIVQLGFFLQQDITMAQAQLNRVEHDERLSFFEETQVMLQPLEGQKLRVYYDYRLYVPPETPNWRIETSFDLLSYSYIQEGDFDVLLLLQQRIWDYTKPDAVGIDPEAFAISQQFYRDADAGEIEGYDLVYRTPLALVFIKESLCAASFPAPACHFQ
jgi:hypothetical protein